MRKGNDDGRSQAVQPGHEGVRDWVDECLPTALSAVRRKFAARKAKTNHARRLEGPPDPPPPNCADAVWPRSSHSIHQALPERYCCMTSGGRPVTRIMSTLPIPDFAAFENRLTSPVRSLGRDAEWPRSARRLKQSPRRPRGRWSAHRG